MLTDLPCDDTLYDALVACDPSYEGRAWVGVTSTGILCRLTCPARKPLKRNCRFFSTLTEGLEAGFRPCKRCTPLTPERDTTVGTLIAALESDPTKRWREADIVQMGFDPSAVRRAFRRHLGMSFLELARLRRLGAGFTALAQGDRVVDAQIDAGWDSASGFRTAFGRLMGCAPGNLPSDAPLRATWIDSELGPMIAVACAHRLHLLEFADRRALPKELSRLGPIGVGDSAPADQARGELDAYFAGRRAQFNVPLQMHGSAFTRDVWHALRDIPAGETRSYGALARTLGRPTASRAVARANGANQIAIVIPCHRVIGADGALTGYGGGLWRKQRLIEIEAGYR